MEYLKYLNVHPNYISIRLADPRRLAVCLSSYMITPQGRAVFINKTVRKLGAYATNKQTQQTDHKLGPASGGHSDT